MYTPRAFTIINRPEQRPGTDVPRWNLVAREIGGAMLLPAPTPELPEHIRRQNAVLSALAGDITTRTGVIQYSRIVHRVEVKNLTYEISAAKQRYRAATTLEALSLAIADGSVPITRRPAVTGSEAIAESLNLLKGGSTIEDSAAANGFKVSNERQIQWYIGLICREFGVNSLPAALRVAHEYGVVGGQAPLRPEGLKTGKFTAPKQVGFTLPFRRVRLTRREHEVARARTAGFSAEAISLMHYVSLNTVYTQWRRVCRKLEAPSAAEAVTKLIVLGLAEPSRVPPHIIGNVSVRELSTLTGVVQGFSHPEIACRLGLGSVNTVKTHMRKIMRKTGAIDRTAAVLCMFQMGVFKSEGMSVCQHCRALNPPC